MRKSKFTLCFLLSFLIHLGIVFGINLSLIPTPGMPERPDIIPVDMVVIEEEEEEPSSKPILKETEISKDALIARAQTSMGTLGLPSLEDFPGPMPKEATLKPTLYGEEEEPSSSPTLKETEFSEDALIAKAQTAMGTPGPTNLEDLPGPIPKEGTFKPSLNVEQIPTPGVLATGQEGEEAESRRVVSRSLNPAVRLPEIPHTHRDESPLLEAEKSRVLSRAEKGGVSIHSTTLEEANAPLGRSRPHPEFVSDLPPVPTVSSPALAEEREMILGRKEESLQPRSARLTASRPLRVRKETGKEIAHSRRDDLFPRKPLSLEPLMTDLEKKGTFVGREKGFSILLVLDTSGSVKGSPLEGIKKSAMEFVHLLGEGDRCAVITFNDEASLVVPFTSDKNRLRQGIARLLTRGKNTVLFDALDRAFGLLGKEKDRRRFVVLFSDGKDEGSRSTTEEVIGEARRSGISVFSLGYSRIDKSYLRILQGISQSTGGIFAEDPHFREVVELFRAARDVKGNRGS